MLEVLAEPGVEVFDGIVFVGISPEPAHFF